MKSNGVTTQMKLLQQYFHMVLNAVLSKYSVIIKVYWTEIEPKGETMQSIPSLFPWHPFNSCYLSNMFNEFLFISSVFCTGWTLKLAAGTDTFSLK